MCEANVYLVEGEEPKLIMEAVDTVEPEDGGLRLISIFGDQKFIKAQIHLYLKAFHSHGDAFLS